MHFLIPHKFIHFVNGSQYIHIRVDLLKLEGNLFTIYVMDEALTRQNMTALLKNIKN
jgi:hypothetical protein